MGGHYDMIGRCLRCWSTMSSRSNRSLRMRPSLSWVELRRRASPPFREHHGPLRRTSMTEYQVLRSRMLNLICLVDKTTSCGLTLT